MPSDSFWRWSRFPVGLLGLLAACGGGSEGDSPGSTGGSSAAGGGGSPYGFLSDGALTNDDVSATWAALPYASMSLERTSCFGSCPDYTVQFTRGTGDDAVGPASYEGRSNAEREGNYTGDISIWDYGRLCQLLDQFGFMTFDESYVANWTDDSSAIVEVQRLSSSRRVLDYGRQGPPELIALQLAMDAIADRIAWTKGSVP